MHDPVAVQVVDAACYLEQKLGCLFLAEGASSQDLLIKVAVAVLHDEVHFLPAHVITVGGEDVGVLAV